MKEMNETWPATLRDAVWLLLRTTSRLTILISWIWLDV
jgi:hypothetical protein